MQVNFSAVVVIFFFAVFGYGIPAYLLLRRADVSRLAAALLVMLLLIPVVNCVVLYFLTWVFRRRRSHAEQIAMTMRLARS